MRQPASCSSRSERTSPRASRERNRTDFLDDVTCNRPQLVSAGRAAQGQAEIADVLKRSDEWLHAIGRAVVALGGLDEEYED